MLKLLAIILIYGIGEKEYQRVMSLQSILFKLIQMRWIQTIGTGGQNI